MDLELSQNTAGVASEQANHQPSTKIKSELDENQRELIQGLTKKVDSNLIIEQADSLAGAPQNAVEILRRQLEFYFGDPNLCKDAYLREQIAKNPKGYVDLKVLLGFHKIGQILNAHNINKFEDRLGSLRQAVTSSSILKLCKQGLRAKRKIPFDQNLLKNSEYLNEVGSRTIYVENIPTYASQELLARVFAKYGRILLVDLPKEAERKKKRNKGFAFIEFEVRFANKTKEAATAALLSNNSIPKEFMSDTHNMPIEPLRVILKTEWLRLKEEFKKVVQSDRDQKRAHVGQESASAGHPHSARRVFGEDVSDSARVNQARHKDRVAARLPAELRRLLCCQHLRHR